MALEADPGLKPFFATVAPAPAGGKVETGDGSPEAGGAGEAAIGEAAAIEAAEEAAAAATCSAGSISRPSGGVQCSNSLHPL